MERLGSAPDLYYLHRIDPGMSLITSFDAKYWRILETPFEEFIGTLDELRKVGKVKYIGLSECFTPV